MGSRASSGQVERASRSLWGKCRWGERVNEREREKRAMKNETGLKISAFRGLRRSRQAGLEKERW